MRRAVLLYGALLLGASIAARGDSPADLSRPSSTVPGCLNDWGPLGTASCIAQPTCEGKAVLGERNDNTAAVHAARATLVNASNRPDQAPTLAVVDAIDACAAAANAMARLYHPTPKPPHELATTLAWTRGSFEQQKLPVVASIGDGFHIGRSAAHRGVRAPETRRTGGRMCRPPPRPALGRESVR
jgi:hypothetical protein